VATSGGATDGNSGTGTTGGTTGSNSGAGTGSGGGGVNGFGVCGSSGVVSMALGGVMTYQWPAAQAGTDLARSTPAMHPGRAVVSWRSKSRE
jgi:hypothetical protein